MSDPSDEARAERLQHEIESVRENLGGLVSELDHRRHEAFDVGLQLRQHAVPLIIAGTALLGVTAGGVTLAIRRSRARNSFPARALRLGQAFKRMAEHPERQAAPPPNLGLKILAAAGAAAASMLARRLMQRLLASPPARQR